MKRVLLLLLMSIIICDAQSQSVGIGTTTPNTSAQLDVQSTSKGMLIPRMTQAELNAIPSPAQGLMAYNTSTNSFQYYNGSVWLNITHSGIVNGIANRVPKFNSPWGMTAGMMTDNGNGISINTGGTAADPSATLDISSTTKGVLVPRMSSVQRTAIVAPVAGLLVFDNTTNTFWFHNGMAWTELVSGGGAGSWAVNGTSIYNTNTGTVGIHTTTPDASYSLDVEGPVRFRSNQHINQSLTVDGSLSVNGATNLFGNVAAQNNIYVGGDITSVDNVHVFQSVTVSNGKAIVRSANGNQQVVTFPVASVTFGNVPVGYAVDVTFGLLNVYAGNPVISLGNISNATGPFERWQFSIHSIDIAAHTFLVRMFCPNGSGPVTMTLNFIAIGTAL